MPRFMFRLLNEHRLPLVAAMQLPGCQISLEQWSVAGGLMVEINSLARLTMNRFLLSLWLAGAVLYAGSTLLSLNNFADPFGGEPDRLGHLNRAGSIDQAGRNGTVVETPFASAQTEIGSKSGQVAGTGAQVRPDATAPEIPPFAKTSVDERAHAQGSDESLIVTSATAIHDGPSGEADIIGEAQPGGRVQVAEREAEWVRFVDPASGRSGWIDADALEPRQEGDIASVGESPANRKAVTTDEAQSESNYNQVQQEDERQADPSTNQSASDAVGEDVASHQRPRSKPKAENKEANRSARAVPPDSPHWAKDTRRRAHEYAEFPPDAEFIPPQKRRFGILARRRMLRQGFTSAPWSD